MEKKRFVVTKVSEFDKYEEPTKENVCIFCGTQEQADEIEKTFGTQYCGLDKVWIEAEEAPETSDVRETLELCGYEFPEEKKLAVYFFKENDGIYVYKRRPDRTEEEAKPTTRKVFSVGMEFANILHRTKYDGVEWSIVINYRRADNIVDVAELEQIAEDVESKAKIEFRCE